jgi:hypothetical protein
MSPAEKLGMRKRLLTLSLAKPISNAEAIFKTYDLFIHGGISYVTYYVRKIVLRRAAS